MRRLQAVGYRVIPVNPNETEVLGEKAYPSLEDIPDKVDIVDVFRRAESTPSIADSSVRIGARAALAAARDRPTRSQPLEPKRVGSRW